ncbi:hypothetical protein [Beduinella massiliensis]|uniref:hypothetical protein n=1 Tax=Beduinella massiliensis TaxID=1852363 RepID=UPI0031F7A3EF
MKRMDQYKETAVPEFHGSLTSRAHCETRGHRKRENEEKKENHQQREACQQFSVARPTGFEPVAF